MMDRISTSINDDTYPARVRLAWELTQAMEFWERTAEDMKTRVHGNPLLALESGPQGFGGVGCTGFMDMAVMASVKAKLLRLWISELHVLEKDVKGYKPK